MFYTVNIAQHNYMIRIILYEVIIIQIFKCHKHNRVEKSDNRQNRFTQKTEILKFRRK